MKIELPKRSKEHQLIIKQITNIILAKGGDKIAFVILFGSFARGDWVRDISKQAHITYEYASDYDILVITKHNKDGTMTKGWQFVDEVREEIRKKSLDNYHITSIIVEPLNNVNKALRTAQYFFSDIKKEGILLYSSGDRKLDEAKKLTNKQRRIIAQNDFDNWFDNGKVFLKGCKFYLSEKDYKIATFQLHQATESFFHCNLLVFTNYRPKLHDIEILNRLCSSQHNQFITIFPIEKEEKRECFQLLRKAYIEARYNKDYKITKEQLEYLITRVEKLKEVTKTVCEEKIRSFK